MNKLFIAGTRPEIIKYSPLIKIFKPYFLFTGQQHTLANDALTLFNIIPDMNLKCSPQNNQSLAMYLSVLIGQLDKEIKRLQPKQIWVMGDTTSAYAGALVAKLNKVELVHLEAGLRTHDNNNPYPEEMFRTAIDHMSDILLAPTDIAVKNLVAEQVCGVIHLTGNTIVDTLEMIKKKLPKERPIKEKYVLATVHRRESLGKDMFVIFNALKELSKKIKVILPAHSNPNVKKVIKKVGLDVVKPMNYINFLWHLRDCEFVITDSGGIIEEAPSFNKKILIVRKVIERQEILDTGYALTSTLEKKDLIEKINYLLSMREVIYKKNPFGDGKASDRILEIMSFK